MLNIRLGILIVTVGILLSPYAWTATSRELDAVAHFEQAPTLRGVSLTDEQVVYFTIAIPENAGEALAQLSLSDHSIGEGTRLMPFNLEKTRAFFGTPQASGEAIALQGTWIDEVGVIWVGFEPALEPGTVFTVALEVGQNPPSGEWEYGLAAYPDTANPIPVFVGDGTVRVQSIGSTQN